METRRYPIGIQTFSEIITGNYVYVDKTKYIYDIAKLKYVFLSRPRRFGKSLLTTTLESYFLGQKELFKGLAIDSLETEWQVYPVLHFDMSWAKLGTIEDISSMLNFQLAKYEEKYGIQKTSDNFGIRLTTLITGCATKFGKNTVVLIDEYDAQLLNVIDEPDKLKNIRNFMRSFFAPLKACDAYLRFVFITGITKFSQVSIFSELNNLKNISMMSKYSAICGISQSEIENQLMDDVKALAEEEDVTADEALEMLKRQYDGYHFSSKSEDIYNPFSLINALSDLEVNSYWFSSGTPTFLVKLMKKFGIDIRILDNAEALSSEFDAPTEGMTSILPILYQSGYITIKGYNRATELYQLGMPNKEVAFGLMNALIPYYVSPDTQTTSSTMAKMYDDLRHDNMDSALNRLKAFMAAVPYELENKTEKHFQTIIYVIFKMMTKYVDVEISTATGRIDMVLKTNTCIYVMEFKLDKSADAAVAQIDTKDYLIPYTLDNRKVKKVGINFSSKTRTLDGWVIENC
ncbi:MAG: ATP-binding protein [Muribaculaceae bacterium]|jgi:hypothetical protein|nr:ATP-binding protein [Muribaculaceae bacterium]